MWIEFSLHPIKNCHAESILVFIWGIAFSWELFPAFLIWTSVIRMRRCPRKWSHSRGALGKVCDANRLKAAPSNNGGNSGSDVVSKIKVHHLSHLNMNAGFSLSTIHVSLSGTVWAAPYRTERSNSDKFIRFNYPFICLSALGTCWLMRRKLWFSTWDAPPTSLEKTTKSFLLSLTSRSHLLRRLKVWEVQQSHQTNGTAHRLAAEIPEGRRNRKES